MAELDQLAGPMMGRCARLHANETRRQLLEELDQLATPELPSDGQLAHLVDAMHLEHVLRQIQTDRGNLHVDAPLIDSFQRSPYGTSMPGAGAVHLIKSYPRNQLFSI
jgi:hypothetical protein